MYIEHHPEDNTDSNCIVLEINTHDILESRDAQLLSLIGNQK
jgi:pterin-4a-carbinolamine dehydratase